MDDSGDGGVGPIGTSTNNPSIDTGTTARIQHTAPGDRMKPEAGKPKLDYFDVSRLLPVLDKLGWKEGKRFMKFWIDGKACTAKTDPKKKDKATISVNLDNACMRIVTVSWDWLLSFKEAKDPYDDFVRENLFNEAAKNQLITSYARTPGKFGEFLKDGLKPEDFVGEIKKHQLQSMPVDVDADTSRLNDETAAMANFGYFAMYQGQTFLVGELEKQKADLLPYLSKLGLAPRGPYPLKEKDDADWIAGLKERWKQYESIIAVKAAGIYAGDIYEFGGFQYLGKWDLVKNTVGGSKWSAGWTRVHNSPAPDANVVDVENELFRVYRDKTSKGGDFLVFTPIKLITFERPHLLHVSRGR
jgi:hypothetical protein